MKKINICFVTSQNIFDNNSLYDLFLLKISKTLLCTLLSYKCLDIEYLLIYINLTYLSSIPNKERL